MNKYLTVMLLTSTLALALTGCGTSDQEDSGDGPPTTDPAAAGVLRVDQSGIHLTGTDDDYYEDALLLVDDGTPTFGADDTPGSVDDLVDGATVEVWIDVCRETFPVQCEVDAIRVG